MSLEDGVVSRAVPRSRWDVVDLRRADLTGMKEKVDYGRKYTHAVLRTKIVCQSGGPPQNWGTVPGRFIWHGTRAPPTDQWPQDAR